MVFNAKQAAEDLFSKMKQYAADECDDSVFNNQNYKTKALDYLENVLTQIYDDEDADLFALEHNVFDELKRLATEAGNVSIFNNRNYRNAALEVIGGGIIGEALSDASNSRPVWI